MKIVIIQKYPIVTEPLFIQEFEIIACWRLNKSIIEYIENINIMMIVEVDKRFEMVFINITSNICPVKKDVIEREAKSVMKTPNIAAGQNIWNALSSVLVLYFIFIYLKLIQQSLSHFYMSTTILKVIFVI